MRKFDGRFVPLVRRWYRGNGRTLPWRGESDPYRIILSEIMLQQTQVSRVLEKYPLFLRRFPSMRALAGARRSDVVRAWRGMGYNNRAVRLHALASVLVERGIAIPADARSLQELPGIGRYTAHAILSSVHGLPVPLVDVNVQRLISRVFWRMPSTADMKDEAAIWAAAERILPRRKVYAWNQALMDLGATVCTARRPLCPGCPLGSICASRDTMKRATRGERRPEPGLKGVPNRVLRGRVIETLRIRRRETTARAIGRLIHPAFTGGDRRWLGKLLEGLERDGLIRIRPRRDSLASRVVLA